VVLNLNPYFNVVWLQTITESIQRLVPQYSPLVALAHHGVEAVDQIVVAEPSMDNQQGEPSIGNRSNDQAKHVRSKEASSASAKRRLTKGDGHVLADLCNAIDIRRHNWARMSFPCRRSPARAPHSIR
jgi:hypothetical protein